MKRKLVLLGSTFLLIFVISSFWIFPLHKNANTILVTNSSGMTFDNMFMVFADKDVVPIKEGETISIPEKFEASIILRLELNGKEKDFIVEGYYGTYERKYIRVEILDQEKTGKLKGVSIKVQD